MKIILFDLHFYVGFMTFFGWAPKHKIHLRKKYDRHPKIKKNSQNHQERGHSASITAKSTTVIWRLHRSALHLPVTLAWLKRGWSWRMTPPIPIHTRNLTWNLKISPWKRKVHLETIIFRFHVKFRGCTI